MTEIAKLITRLFQVVCLIIVDLFAFYMSLFIAWALRSEVMPYFVNQSAVPPFLLPAFHFVLVDTRYLHRVFLF